MTDEYLRRLFGLGGRLAMVTGASSGIGRAIAMALGRAGAELILVARGEEALARTVKELADEGATATHLPVDLADRDAIAALTSRVPHVDILVNAAGVNIRPPLPELTVADWDRTIAVNLTAPYLLGQHFGPSMAARGFGRIITVTSQQSVRAYGNSGGYGASKAGVAGLIRSQAEAWSRDGVCCNSISPGVVHTPMTEAIFADPERALAMAERTLVGRNGEPEDFAGAAVFLSSAAAAHITGQALFVDGGFSVH
ncbi:glucose 1-dehydrogenase [Rugosimonospora acidiphila]|uniref:Glucose 1-dehydrogenase n=1 Tax=Rugosimonospora acidiphila TaxID=556531 RepID=A0ABP9RQA8_9ACTN